MRYEFKLPDLAEGMVEGEIVDWLVASGDDVRREQPIVEIMTDKATVVIPSPTEGQVVELNYEAGDIAEVGTTLFVLEVADDAVIPGHDGTPTSVAEIATASATPQAAAGPVAAPVAAAAAAAHGASAAPSGAPRVARGPGKALATPATRRLARELGVDIGAVTGTGPGGRVQPEDVRAFAGGGATAAPAPSPAPAAVSATPLRPAPQRPAPPTPSAHTRAITAPGPRPAAPPPPVAAPLPRATAPASVPPSRGTEERVKIRGLRRAIFETMTRSSSTAAHFTYVDEVDCENLVAARDRLKGAAEAAGVRLTYLPFIAKATLLALRRFPKMNATVDDAAGEVVLKGYYHLGIAAATPDGLMVPVIADADRLTLLELAAATVRAGEGARTGTLAPHELRGSTFTITSLGKLGGLLATPIINHPEVAIMGVHAMTQRAVVRDGAVVIRRMMNISLSFDHRLIDGHEGAAFASEVKRYLEDPELMLLEMV